MDVTQNVGDDGRIAREPREAATARAREPVSLKAALRRARLESAERGDAQDELMGAAVARLDLLREQLEPVFAQLPEDCDLFDLGLNQGEKPRLFIDMIAFVELTRDRRGFRFLQETRNGRVLLAESDQADVITQAVADYLARRLIEREKALSAATNPAIQPLHSVGLVSAPGAQQPAPGKPPRARPGFLRYLARGFAFLIEVIGSAVFFGLLAAGVWWLWKTYFH
ncbi:MAG: hypothetical protein M9883_15015 [Methylobacteriaceae bacterium]|nr:hypothetical protein [Methylobacteriaceae bacterium]